jgi:hypothetical protein
MVLATWEADIGRTDKVQGSPGQMVHKTPSPNIITAKWTGEQSGTAPTLQA